MLMFSVIVLVVFAVFVLIALVDTKRHRPESTRCGDTPDLQRYGHEEPACRTSRK